MSRLTTYTPAKHRLMLDALRAGCTVREACSHAGIEWATFKEWTRRVRAGDRFHDGVASLVDEYEHAAGQGTAALVAQIKMQAAKDFRAAAYLIDRRDALAERRLRSRKTRADAMRAEVALERERLELRILQGADMAGATDEELATVRAILERARTRGPTASDTGRAGTTDEGDGQDPQPR